MEAPVPYLVGLQRSTREKASGRTGHTSHSLVKVYVDFDQITAPEEASVVTPINAILTPINAN